MSDPGMNLSEIYAQQLAFRDFASVMDRLPLQQARVLDLGCGVGEVARMLADRGAFVTGLDANESLLEAARSRHVGLDFRRRDLWDELPELGKVDGVWSSFLAAYFPDLAPHLRSFTRELVPGGFCALIEIDDLFGHEPLAKSTQKWLTDFADQAYIEGRYDFRMGRRLHEEVRKAGLVPQWDLDLVDRELSFQGPAEPVVIEAWRARFQRMQMLQRFCGPHFEAVQRDFLQCIASPEHRASARVVCCVATRP